jgi:Mg-chelatase subunit ChlD
MPGGQGRGLWDGSSYNAIKQVETDVNGNASAQFRIANIASSNLIYMDTIGNMVTAPETWIEGISADFPCYISQLYPAPNAIAADGAHQFGLYYTVYDKYMNPVNNTGVLITASDGTYLNTSTNSLGTVFTSFGPKDRIGHFNITAIPIANSSAVCQETGTIGYCEQVVEFYNTDPVDLIATANPQGMPSLDVSGTAYGTIQARVVDIKGNPVIGENVRYSMGTVTYPGGPYNVTAAPSISATSAPVAAGGFSAITFRPGSFASYGALNYNATATGMVTVTATWTDKSGVDFNRDVTFVWKNYPYLGITVPAEACENVKVGDKINVTVKIVGDGAALRPKPIDVILVTDVSGSMAGTKITDAKNAGKIFGASMSSQDRVGLESFGWSASGHWGVTARDDLALTFNKATVNTTIDTYAASSNTPARPAIYNATRLIKYNPRAGAVTAMVLMTDGQWNTCGDPRGISSSYERMAWVSPQDPVAATESVVTFAKNNGIKIYTVGLGSDANGAELLAYATETGGKYYYAPSSSQLAGIYKQIAGDLQETAGGNTMVSLDFGTVKINDVMGGDDIRNYMSYVTDVHIPAQPTDSTYLNKTNLTPSGVMNFLPGYPTSQDDSGAWNTRSMSFAVGEVKLNSTWSATFRLNLTQAGKVEMFGVSNPSKICFTDASTGATTCQFIPSLQCNIQQSTKNVPFGDKYIFLGNLTATNNGPDPNILTLKWNTTYDGVLTAQETVGYKLQDSNAIPLPVSQGILFEPNCYEKTNILTVDTTTWTPGTYDISVTGVALDATKIGGDSTNPAHWTKPGAIEQKYIKLE